jgi:hypothetical protein
MVMIRRELPLTNFASPAGPVAYFRRGFSFVLAPAAADPVLHHPTDEDLSVGTLVDLDNVVHELNRFCFFLLWEVFAFVLSVPLMPPFVVCRRLRP